MPTLYVSHGAPNVVLHDVPARRFFDSLAAQLPPPRAIVVASAHYDSARPAVTVSAAPPTIHDFSGFEPELYQMRYAAPGAPELAARIATMIEQALGVASVLDEAWGLDHGAWSPLSRIYPAADIPVLEVSIRAAADPAYHLALGRALSRLPDEDVLVVGSGSITHNLGLIVPPMSNDAAPAWVRDFLAWFEAALIRGDEAAILDYRHRAPAAQQAHPSDEHLLPLYVACGAAGTDWRARRLHHSVTFGTLAMDTWQFESAAV